MSEVRKIRVLIVDDHDMVRQGIRVLLENFDDFEVVGEAPHGQAGVNLCRVQQPARPQCAPLWNRSMRADRSSLSGFLHVPCSDVR